jgi:Tfp pilus assembly protein PilX
MYTDSGAMIKRLRHEDGFAPVIALITRGRALKRLPLPVDISVVGTEPSRRARGRLRLTAEDGIALVMALGITLVLGILVFAMISYTTAGQRSAQASAGNVLAGQYAESGLGTAYSVIYNQTAVSGGNPAAANLLACNGVTGASDVNGPSNCSTLTTAGMKLVCIAASTCAAGEPGTASMYGYFSGTNAQTFSGPGASAVAVPASTWLLVSTGYARNPSGVIEGKSTTATVKISPLDGGAVASVWNHMFITSPLVANQCSVDFGGNNMTIVDPLYVIGNLCLSGSGTAIYEVAGGQPGRVGDLAVRQRLVQLLGNDEGLVRSGPRPGDVAR